MNEKSYNYLTAQLMRHEGVELKPYRDTVGKLTIGVGRNLDDKGITKDEALIMLQNDISEVIESLETMDFFNRCNEVRKIVLANMAFNLGIAGLLKFKKMIAAINADNYQLAANEMLDSKWSRQVKQRANELAEMMVEGEIV